MELILKNISKTKKIKIKKIQEEIILKKKIKNIPRQNKKIKILKDPRQILFF